MTDTHDEHIRLYKEAIKKLPKHSAERKQIASAMWQIRQHLKIIKQNQTAFGTPRIFVKK